VVFSRRQSIVIISPEIRNVITERDAVAAEKNNDTS